MPDFVITDPETGQKIKVTGDTAPSEQEIEQIPTLMQTGASVGMKTMDKSLKELYQTGVISYETAISKAKNVQEFKHL